MLDSPREKARERRGIQRQQTSRDPARVRAMFARIARRYDLLNHVLSAGIDRRWRRRTVRQAGVMTGDLSGKMLVDVCSGTGDMALAFRNASAHVVGVDFTPEMLARAWPRVGPRARSSSAGMPCVCP